MNQWRYDRASDSIVLHSIAWRYAMRLAGLLPMYEGIVTMKHFALTRDDEEFELLRKLGYDDFMEQHDQLLHDHPEYAPET